MLCDKALGGYKGMQMVSNNTQVDYGIKTNAQVVLRGAKPQLLTKGRVVIYTKSWPYLNRDPSEQTMFH